MSDTWDKAKLQAEVNTLRAECDELRKWKEDNSEAMRVFARYRELEAERDAAVAEAISAGIEAGIAKDTLDHCYKTNDELRTQLAAAVARAEKAEGERTAAEIERDVLRAWVNTIAAQKLEGEMEDDDERENADYQGAYDKIVEEARSLVSVRIDSALKEGDGA